MIGNDIVDLTLAKTQSNWQRRGYLGKIFTKEEQSIILSSNNPFQFVWLFWSMKESAYKIYVRKHQKRYFAPIKLRCELISKSQGLVEINNEIYYTIAKVTGDYIFTEAVENCNDAIEHNHFKFSSTKYAEQSKKVYHKLKVKTSKILAESIDTIKIKKDSVGVPKLYQNNKQLRVSFSISHHGSFGAYSILNTLK